MSSCLRLSICGSKAVWAPKLSIIVHAANLEWRRARKSDWYNGNSQPGEVQLAMNDNVNRPKRTKRNRRRGSTASRQAVLPQIAAENADAAAESLPHPQEEPARGTWRTWRDRLSYVYLIVLLPCLIYTVYYTARAIWFDYTPVPVTDNWRFVAYLDELLRFSPRHFWLQHNDHRIIFPEMIYGLDFILFGGRLLFPAVFNIACQIFQIGILWWLLARSELPRAFRLALGAASALFMTSTMHVGGILGSLLLVWYLSLSAAALCFLFLWRTARTGRLSSLLISVMAAVIATYSVGNGMVIWPVMTFMAALLRIPRRRIAGVAVAGIVSISAYFVGYRFLRQGRTSLLLHHPFYAIWFASVYVGSPVSYVNILLGGLTGVTGLLLVGLAVALAVRQRRTTDAAFAVAGGVCLFVAASALMIAYGRMEPGDAAVGAARTGRYISVQLTYWANLAILIGWLATRWLGCRLFALHLAAVGLTAVLLAAVMDEQKAQESAFATFQASADEAGIALLTGIDDPDVLRAIYPDPGFPPRYVAGIREKRLSIFASGRQDWIGQPVEHVFSGGPPSLCSGAIERVEPVTGGYRAVGWALDRETGHAVKDIVLVDPGGVIIGLAETRPGGYAPHLDNVGPPSDWVGFARAVRAPESVRAYAVVGNGKMSCALGALPLVGSSARSPGKEVDEGPPAAAFANEISLSGYSIQDKGGHTEVEFRWSILRRPSADYSVFVHVLDASGHLAFQADHALRNGGGAPTSAWTVGDSVEDRFFVTPPSNRQPGTYALKVGVDIPSPLKILSLTEATLPRGPTDDWKDRSVVIRNVECK